MGTKEYLMSLVLVCLPLFLYGLITRNSILGVRLLLSGRMRAAVVASFPLPSICNGNAKPTSILPPAPPPRESNGTIQL